MGPYELNICVPVLPLAIYWVPIYTFYSPREDILAGPHKFRGLFEDLDFRFRLEQGLGQGVS